MGKAIVVEGCQFELTPASNPPATITIQSQPSAVFKCDGKKVYTTPMLVMIAGYTGGSISDPGSGMTASPCSISSTAQHVKTGGLAVMLENDQGVAVVQGTSGGGQTPQVVSVTVKISSAGQTVVTGI